MSRIRSYHRRSSPTADGLKVRTTASIGAPTRFQRPIAPPHAGTMALFERARRIAGELDIELTHCLSGGGSDGNFTGALGLPTLDGIGVAGAGAHTFGEHLLVSSLVPRCRILAELLLDLGPSDSEGR